MPRIPEISDETRHLVRLGLLAAPGADLHVICNRDRDAIRWAYDRLGEIEADRWKSSVAAARKK
jgi:hypothetical protein